MAGLYSFRIKHLITVEGFGPWINPNKTNFVDDFTKAVATNKVILSKTSPVYTDFDAAVQRWQQTQPNMKLQSLQTLVTRSIEKIEGGVRFTQDKNLRCSSLVRMSEEQVNDCLLRIKCPILVILGSKGFLFSEQDQWLKKFYPRRKQVVIESLNTLNDSRIVFNEVVVDGHHHVHLDNAEPVAGAILNFFSSLSPSFAPSE